MPVPVANIVGISYVDIASTRMANLQATLDTVLAAETQYLKPVMAALGVMFIARQMFLYMHGDLGFRRMCDSLIRALIVVFLIAHNGEYANRVRTPIFTTIPQAFAHIIGGQYTGTTATQPLASQFDSAAAKSDAISTEIDAVSTNVFSPADWINSLSGHTSNMIFQIILGIIVGIWMMGQTIIAILLALGMPVLLMELFERTRSFVDQWIGKIVGAAAFGFATSFVLAIQLNQMQTMFLAIKGQAANNATAAVGMFGHVVANGIVDVLVMAVLPTAVGFGSGAIASLSMPSMALAMSSLSLSSTAISTVAKAAGKAVARKAT